MQQNIITELEELKTETDFIVNNKEIVDNKDIEKFLKSLEKIRYEIFNKIELDNKYQESETNKILYNNTNYKAWKNNNILKIHIPETIPKFKNISNYAYKNIMMNTAEIVKEYRGLFKEKLTFVVIIVHEKQANWDIDNKYVKPIIDSLVIQNIIADDNINNMLYLVLGKNDTKQAYTETFVMDAEYIMGWIQNLQKMF